MIRILAPHVSKNSLEVQTSDFLRDTLFVSYNEILL